MASIIKTDNIQKVSDDSNIIKKCGSTTTVGSGAGNTITVDGATVTLGRCGGTVSLASGATQTGFGQTYTAVDFCTTAKTSPFTAVSGKGYFVNTTSGAVTVTLPASPSAGDIVAIKDYADTFDTNEVILCRNSSKIGGNCSNSRLLTEGQSISMVYVDATRGWLNVNTDSTVSGSEFISATGGTITTCGDYKIHTFTADGCFSVVAGFTAPNNVVSYQVVAGGGAGGNGQGGGGGAGGFREGKDSPDPYTASPLDAGSGLPVTSGSYPITVGGGGAGGTGSGAVGSNSVFSTITSSGGGGGGSPAGPEPFGGATNGGSGGGGGEGRCGQAGNNPPVSPPQGNAGGNSNSGTGAGGGGAGAAGTSTSGPSGTGGAGGAGVSTSITGSSVASGGGGGGGSQGPPGGGPAAGGTGGGGPSNPAGGSGTPGTPGTVNTGGGGGSGSIGCNGGDGGSGIVVIRYKFQ